MRKVFSAYVINFGGKVTFSVINFGGNAIFYVFNVGGKAAFKIVVLRWMFKSVMCQRI